MQRYSHKIFICNEILKVCRNGKVQISGSNEEILT